MSHITGTVQPVSPTIGIGPDFSNSTINFVPTNPPSPVTPPGGIKMVMLHFSSALLPANNRLEVDLGYDTDVFTAADGPDFWTRPIHVQALAGGSIPIRYIINGSLVGGVRLIGYGRGERHEQDPSPGFPSYSNSDPFLTNGAYTEPQYATFWFCHTPPHWANVATLGAADIRRTVAQSTCMIVSVHGGHVSTCSGTLIGPDTIITAGHCMDDPINDAHTSSVIFNYQTDAGGGRPAGYSPRFYKIARFVKYGTLGGGPIDYMILQLKTPPIGVPIIPMRVDLPSATEEVFGIHHPNGAVKKSSIKPDGTYHRVLSSSSAGINVDFDVSGGSSGSGLFDRSGRIVGICSNGTSCNLTYASTAEILRDIASAPPVSPVRDVMLVFDRSGSMSLTTASGRTKIQEARDAASLFVQLIRVGGGHRIGLVSFSSAATNPVEFSLANVTAGSKNTLVGPAPFTGGLVGGLTPSGFTSIGDGLLAARLQFASTSLATTPTILLMTDGLQNTPPMISTVESTLSNVHINAIGFGRESDLDGALLTRLAQTHNGLYTRAGSGLALKKFFALAFGNIFEAGTLFDPDFILKEGSVSAAPIPFAVCEETSMTVVLGWEKTEAPLYFDLRMPSGAILNLSQKGIDTERGETWVFSRVSLPVQGEQNGTWEVLVHRLGFGGEFPPPSVEQHFFVNITVQGGPVLRLLEEKKKFYTGDSYNPLLSLRDAMTFPQHGQMTLTINKPNTAIGNLLAKSGLKDAQIVDGDTLPPRFATLKALEAQQAGKSLVAYNEETVELYEDARNGLGVFEPSGIFGLPLNGIFQAEGHYTFHARATYGEGCTATRELIWTIQVDPGVDPTKTVVTTKLLETLPNGHQRIEVTLTPKDVYGNLLGPGRSDIIQPTDTPDTKITGILTDLGNGDYTIETEYTPNPTNPPTIVIGQPERPSVTLPASDGSTTTDDNKWKSCFLWILALAVLLFIALVWAIFAK